MSPVTSGARWRRTFALATGLLLLQFPLQSAAADRSPARKAVPSKSAPQAAASKKVVAAPTVRKGTLPQSVSPTTVRKQAAVEQGGRLAKALKTPLRAERAARNGKLVRASYAPRAIEPPRLSIGNAIGLHLVDDPLDLRSSVAMVIDQQTGETLYEKNPDAVLPIASITKVMTAMVVLDAGLPMDEMLDIAEADRDTERHSGSRLPIGSKLSRAEMMQLSLMASENRAAHALGRHFPGGVPAFVAAMNAKAQAIGMTDSRFADPTGLSGNNVSNARDLARMVRAAHGYPVIRAYSTANDLTVDTGYRQVTFRSTNRLVDDPNWSIGMQKTGYISEAGKCLVMQARIEGRPVILVLLDAAGAQSRFADAQRLRRWLEDQPRTVRTVADTRS
ncbi:MAG: D-alanyl-D-alanine endopeptidase [Burkholderiales bacterium]|jgi:D-alanyl-D-alanine endopeptidase (penicillin-binding protein 7)